MAMQNMDIAMEGNRIMLDRAMSQINSNAK